MAFISSVLMDKEEEKELHKIFHAYDANGDGELSKEEIMNAYSKYENKFLTEKEMNDIFDKVDVNGDGAL